MIFNKRKKLQHVLFGVIFLNSVIVMVVTCVSMSTECWVIARPYRHIFLNAINNNNSNNEQNTSLSNDSALDEEPIDLYAKKDCKRYYGKIRFGLFKGVWMFNYAYGCKNRIHRAYIIDMLNQHKLFDRTLWICTIFACSLGLFCTMIGAFFSFFNMFISPIQTISGPIGMYLWNSLAGISFLLAMILFASEFFWFINKNILTRDELESGWTSTNRAKLGWSYYILAISVLLIFVNIGLTHVAVRLKRSYAHRLKTCDVGHGRSMIMATTTTTSTSTSNSNRSSGKLYNTSSSPPPPRCAQRKQPQTKPKKQQLSAEILVAVPTNAEANTKYCMSMTHKQEDVVSPLTSLSPPPPTPSSLMSKDTSTMSPTLHTDDTDVRYSRRLKRLLDIIY